MIYMKKYFKIKQVVENRVEPPACNDSHPPVSSSDPVSRDKQCCLYGGKDGQMS